MQSSRKQFEQLRRPDGVSPGVSSADNGAADFADWSDDRLVLDSMGSRENNLRVALDHLADLIAGGA